MSCEHINLLYFLTFLYVYMDMYVLQESIILVEYFQGITKDITDNIPPNFASKIL